MYKVLLVLILKMTRKYLYKRCVDVKYWEEYLNRKLTVDEKLMLKDVQIERTENIKLELIHNLAIQNGLYVGHLTDMDGNCLFESLKYIGLYDDADDLRKGIAFLLLLLENVDMEKEFNCKNILHSSPKTAFELTNEVKYVHCAKTSMLYKYTYQTMCHDLYGDHSWNRLNMEVILRIIAIVFNLGFRIFHTTNYISEIIPESDKEVTIINLGLMGEFHYVPLFPIPNNLETPPKCAKFRSSLKAFHLWARLMARNLERYIDSDTEDAEIVDRIQQQTIESVINNQTFNNIDIDCNNIDSHNMIIFN